MGNTRSAMTRFAKDNTGSAIITVVIAMLFVVALITALLFTAYMGVQVSVSARSERENFYDASAAMDEIKAGIQKEVTDSLQGAYSKILVSYANNRYATETAAQKALEKEFLIRLGSYSAENGAFDTHLNASGNIDYMTLLLSKLTASYVTDSRATVKVAGGVANVQLTPNAENGSLSVKNLTVSYTGDKGYFSEVSTDLVISVPNFFTGASVAASLGEYTIVAYDSVEASAAATGFTIEGGIFAGPGGINTATATDRLTVSGGNIVTSGDIVANLGNIAPEKTTGYLNITTQEGCAVWARGIKANKASRLELSGSCFVSDDLVLNGGADVKLAGSYFGFGSDGASDAPSSAGSSSILVNGYYLRKFTVDGSEKTLNTQLDMTRLYDLTLAGVSFIHTNATSYSGDAKTDLPMGQSMAVKTDQLAYLVPASAITNYKTNPAYLAPTTVVQEGNTEYVPQEFEAPEINYKAFLWAINGQSRTLEYYLGAVKDGERPDGEIVAYYTQVEKKEGVDEKPGDEEGNSRTAYVFIAFKNQNKANEYFRDYFSAKPDSITQYLDTYLYMPQNANLTTTTKGNSYSFKSGKWSLISGTGTEFKERQAAENRSTYEAKTAVPFKDYVSSTVDSDGFAQTLRFSTNAGEVAVVTSGDYTYDSAEPASLRLIVAKGDVTINKNFSGTIICKGTVHVRANISAADIAVVRGATAPGGQAIEDYLAGGLLGGQLVAEKNAWSPDNLVYYKNWQKN